MVLLFWMYVLFLYDIWYKKFDCGVDLKVNWILMFIFFLVIDERLIFSLFYIWILCVLYKVLLYDLRISGIE